MPAAGKQVRLFLAEGTVGGLVTAEIMNWTGHVLRGRRDRLAQIRGRREAQRTGVYILLGDEQAYIGQSDNVANRITQHDQKKDFWNEVVVITSKDANLTSAHVRYLESRLIRLAQEIGRMPLDNGNVPSGGADLPEADLSDMEYFVEQVRVLLPVLGVNLLRGRTSEVSMGVSPEQASASPVFRLTIRGGPMRGRRSSTASSPCWPARGSPANSLSPARPTPSRPAPASGRSLSARSCSTRAHSEKRAPAPWW